MYIIGCTYYYVRCSMHIMTLQNISCVRSRISSKLIFLQAARILYTSYILHYPGNTCGPRVRETWRRALFFSSKSGLNDLHCLLPLLLYVVVLITVVSVTTLYCCTTAMPACIYLFIIIIYLQHELQRYQSKSLPEEEKMRNRKGNLPGTRYVPGM